MSLFTSHHHRLVLRTIRMRYPYLAVMIAGAVTIPAPVNRDVLVACSIFSLLANALAHTYIRATDEHKRSGVAMALADAGVALFAIRYTGMLASPFLIFFPVAMYSAHFLFLDRRTAIVFEAAGIAGYVALAGHWSLSGGSIPGWSASSYPLFTAVIGVMNLLAIALYVFLTFDAGLLAGGLERQREALRAQEEKERLGYSLLAVAEELRNRLEAVKAAHRRGGGLSGELPGDLRDEAAALDARCKDLETEMEDVLDGTIAYARNRMGTPVLAAVSVSNLLREVAIFTRLRYGASAGEVRLGSGVPGLGTARLDGTWIHQALVDLAGDAFARRQAGRPFTVEFDGVERGTTLVLTVRDNGREMLPGELAALAVPGEPVLEDPEGSLQAPRVARRIVEEHGGSLTLDSKPGRGVSFFVILPRGGPDGH